MKKNFFYSLAIPSLIILLPSILHAAPCSFDSNKNCVLQRDILNDKTTDGLHYYAPTNYDHRISGEINIYDATLVTPYTDNVNAPGQLKLLANLTQGTWKSGEIMTRMNLNQPPYNSPQASSPWTTKEVKHGYLEVKVKMPKCDASDDGLCQNNTNPVNYSMGLWPAIWMMPTMDSNWPANGEIDIAEAYPLSNPCLNLTTSALHFNGNDSHCTGGDCKGAGYPLANHNVEDVLYNNFHTWGFEWQPDPASTTGGVVITGYFDNVKIWGPLTTDTLPADGPAALRRGFNDPTGGFYLIVNLAVGGPYAGAPNPHLTSASMYIQSIKSYQIDGDEPPPPPADCKSPTNIKTSFTPDMKSITLNWSEPVNSAPIDTYQVNNAENVEIYKGAAQTFTHNNLSGTPGTYTYYLLSNCEAKQSPPVKVDVTVTAPSGTCRPPRDIKGTWTKDRKSITLTWKAPRNSATVRTYEVHDWLDAKMWEGKDEGERSFTDATLPGRKGKFTYFLYTNCEMGQSKSKKKDVTIR